MKNTQRGFIVPLLLAIIAVFLVGGGVYVYIQNKQPVQTVTESPSVQSTPLTQEQTQTTTSSNTFSENEILASLKTNWTATQALISFRPTYHNQAANAAKIWRFPTNVQFIGKDTILVGFEDDNNPQVAILRFDGMKFSLLDTFKNQAEFTLSAWQNLVTKYGASSYSVSTYTTQLVRNVQIVSYGELTKVPENVFVKN